MLCPQKVTVIASLPSYNIITQKSEIVQVQGPIFFITLLQFLCQGGDGVKLNQAVSERLTQLLTEKGMTQYQLYMKSGVPKSTIGNVINCSYDSVKLRVIHEMCQGLEIGLDAFFDSPLFEENNLEP